MGKEKKIKKNCGDDMWHGGGKWEGLEVSLTLIKSVE